MWSTAGKPAPITAAEPREPTDRAPSLGPAGPGSVLRVLDFFILLNGRFQAELRDLLGDIDLVP